MANRRVLVKRRKSVRNIRKITRTMQLIATARYQSSYRRAAATKPYSEKLAEMVANITRASAGLEHPIPVGHDAHVKVLRQEPKVLRQQLQRPKAIHDADLLR